jgi:AcrR family transcriptional regulator
MTRSDESSRARTTERLLDAAERLFGEHGYDGVGLRQLADEAKVNLGAATYHFGSKQKLYVETFMRRLRLAIEEQLRLLADAEKQMQGRAVSVERIVECMFRPTYMLGVQYPNFHTLAARNMIMPPPFMQEVVRHELEPSGKIFFAALKRALPDMSDQLIVLRIVFSMGALMMVGVQMAALHPSIAPSAENGVLAELVRFASNGLMGEAASLTETLPPIIVRRSPNKSRSRSRRGA